MPSNGQMSPGPEVFPVGRIFVLKGCRVAAVGLRSLIQSLTSVDYRLALRVTLETHGTHAEGRQAEDRQECGRR